MRNPDATGLGLTIKPTTPLGIGETAVALAEALGARTTCSSPPPTSSAPRRSRARWPRRCARRDRAVLPRQRRAARRRGARLARPTSASASPRCRHLRRRSRAGRARAIALRHHRRGARAAPIRPPPRSTPRRRASRSATRSMSPRCSPTLEAIGYFADDRVDEPGEMALRGQVLDVFPADAGAAAADRDRRRPRRRDPHATTPPTSARSASCDVLELGRVAEPALGGERVTLLDHLPGARVAIEPGADERRARFLALAADAGTRRPQRALARRRSTTRAGRRRSATRDRSTLDARRRSAAALRRGASAAARLRQARQGRARRRATRVVLLGGERDLRFLAPPRRQGARPRARARRRLARRSRGARPGTPAVARRCRSIAASGATACSRSPPPTCSAAAPSATTPPPARADAGAVRARRDPRRRRRRPRGSRHRRRRRARADAPATATTAATRSRSTMPTTARRLVPVAEADRIWRYGADADAVTLDKLDGSSWQKRRGEIDARDRRERARR